jgi:hypothetical protein
MSHDRVSGVVGTPAASSAQIDDSGINSSTASLPKPPNATNNLAFGGTSPFLYIFRKLDGI